MAAYLAELRLKNDRKRKERFDGDSGEKDARAFFEREIKNDEVIFAEVTCDGIAIMEYSEKAKINKFSEATSPDPVDGHVHQITNVSQDGIGKTGLAGTPSHSHDIRDGMVIPMKLGEGADAYESIHSGAVTMQAEKNAREKEILRAKKAKAAADKKKFEEKKMKLKFEELKAIEIFATGTHRGREFNEADLDQMVSNFSDLKELIKPPMVIGHDEEQEMLSNSGLPSLGRVVELHKEAKGDGFVLVADFEDVPQLANKAIREKKFTRISSEIYENFENEGTEHGLVLRRVALLGADIPEVKTLADVVALSETDSSLLYTDRKNKKGSTMKTKEKPGTTDPEVLARLAELEKDNKDLKKTNSELTTGLAKEAAEKRKSSISSFCEKLKTDGRFLPMWEEKGIAKFMDSLEDEKTHKFSEGKDAKAVSQAAWFRGFLTSIPKAVEFKEQGETPLERIGREKNMGSGEIKGLKLAEKVKEYIAEQKKLDNTVSYIEAVKTVGRMDPSLVE